jgi:hypothetical protein
LAAISARRCIALGRKQALNKKVISMKKFDMKTLVLAIATASVLVACGGGGGGVSSTSGTPSVNTGSLSGVAAVGTPIVNGTIKITCAGGNALAQSTTTNSGAWRTTLFGQSLPCVVQVSGGTISGAANVTPYHSIATVYGNVNITPMTDLIVANLGANALPSNWFTSISATPNVIHGITQAQVDLAVANLKAAMPSLVSLNTINPLTASFVPTAGDPYDDMLTAIQTAISNSGVTYSTLLSNASASLFTAPPAGFSTALSNAYGGTGTASYAWTNGSAIYSAGSTQTFTPSVSSLSNGKAMAVFAQQEANGLNVYSTLGDYKSASWQTPVAFIGSVGTIAGVSNSSGWNQPTTSTVVVGDTLTGNALAAWTTQVSPETTYRVWVSAYNSTNGIWTTASQVGTALQSGLKTASSSGGSMAIAWVKPSTFNAGKSALGVYISAAGTSTMDSLELGVTGASGWKIGLSGATKLVAAWSGANQQVLISTRGTSSWVSPVVAGAGAPAEDANLSLAVAVDGSVAALWRGLDPSIHTAVYDASGASKSSAALNVGSIDNIRPSVAALPGGKFVAIFAESSVGSGSTLYYDLASCNFDPATGWSMPLVLNTAGDVGSTLLAANSNGSLVAIVHGYNEHAYQLSSSGGLLSSYMHYNGNAPSFTMESSTGRAVMLWTDSTQLAGDFLH